ncbi:MAG: hypothetical protein IKA47_00040, partial [Oscillospiraceae bacterium]|nr:hypothetical protein [Oscillospiraceae bacterium]
QSGEYTLSVIPDLENCFYYNVDSNGYIAFGTGNTKQVPATQSLTVNVTGTEPAGTACPEHTDVTTWTDVAEGAWNAGGTLAAGHYKLTGNQDLTAQLAVAASTSVCIDLNGYTIAATGVHRTIANSGNLTIIDSSENKAGTIKGSNSVNAASGANVYTETGVFNMYGGTITGGKAVAVDATTGYAPTTGSHGGNLYISSGTANIYGGTITGGHARRGGNVFLNNGTFNMFNGTITLGVADRGGNVYSDGRVNVYGGTISNGVGGWGGANMFVYGGGNSIHVYGGSILNGGCKDNKGNAIHSVYGEIYVYGGTFDNREGQNPAGTARTNLIASAGSASSGIAVTHIYGGTFYGAFNLTSSNSDNKVFNGSFTVDMSAYMTDCACMELVDGTYIIWNYDDTCTDCEYEAVLTADAADNKYAIVQQTGSHTPAVSGTSATGYACAYCGTEVAAPTNTKEGTCAHGDHGNVTWLPWDGAATNGHYYVENDMTLAGQITISAGESFCLDLNGKTVTAAEGKRMFNAEDSDTVFNLMDLAGNGKLVGATSTIASGAVVRSSGNFNLYSGTIVGGHVDVNSSDNYYSGAVYVSGGTFNMTGGTITGGKVTNAGTGTAAGGNLYLTGGCTAVISGGIIENGVAGSNGGNISINTGAQVTITGAVTIRNGSAAFGDNIYVRGESSNGTDSLMEIKAGVVIEAGATEASDIVVNTNVGELAIYEGVTLAESCVAYVVCAAERYEASTGVYKTYATLADALDATASGDTVLLAKDATAGAVAVPAGVTLDLNGKTLTADSVTAAFNGTHVVDNKGTGKIDSDSVSVMSNNKQLAVHHEGNVTLETVELAEDLAINGTTGLYKFYIKNEAAATMLDDAIKAGEDVSLFVRVTWTKGGVDKYNDYACSNTHLQEYAGNWDEKMFTLTFSDLTDIENLACTVMVTSGGVTVEA